MNDYDRGYEAAMTNVVAHLRRCAHDDRATLDDAIDAFMVCDYEPIEPIHSDRSLDDTDVHRFIGALSVEPCHCIMLAAVDSGRMKCVGCLAREWNAKFTKDMEDRHAKRTG